MAAVPPLVARISVKDDGSMSILVNEKPSACTVDTESERASRSSAGLQLAMRCLNAVYEYNPNSFDVSVSGFFSESVSPTVRLRKEALERLPLLHDLVQSTDLAYMEVGEVNAVPLHPPTDIWHLVSLALVLEEAPHATLWLLHPAAPPSLLAGTLQMADYMGAQMTVQRICSLFKVIFIGLPTETEYLRVKECENHEKIRPLESLWELFTRDPAHAVNVISYLPERFCNDVLGRSLSLPQACQKPGPAFCKWLQSQGSTLDIEPCSPKGAGRGSQKEAAAVARKAIKYLHRCPGIQSLIVQRLQQARRYTPMPTSMALYNRHIGAIHLRDILLADIASSFLSGKDPLGVLGREVTHLSFSSTKLGKPQGQIYVGLSEGVSAETQRWVFFRAISKLERLTTLDVELDFWADLMSCGSDPTAPLQRLPGLVVRNIHGHSMLARFGVQHTFAD